MTMQHPLTSPASVAPGASKPVLSLRNLTKSFAGKTVVDGVSFDLRAGEAIALVGENGAGKSTTKNMLCGLLQPSSGTISVNGVQVDRLDGAQHGISAVHQELSLFPSLSVAENMCIMSLPGHPARVDWAQAERTAKEQLDFLGIDIDPRATVETLGAGKQQIVEIAKALLLADKVLILDEPTTSLTAPERQKLFDILDKLKARGLAIVFISHFMDEIYRVCDSCVVLRDGQQVGDGPLSDMPQRRLEELMVGRAMAEAHVEPAPPLATEALRVESLTCEDFRDISFSLRKGEIMGLAGLMGAGRTEVAEAIFGIRQAEGNILVGGKPVRQGSVGDMKRRNLCYVPEDRRTNGLFLNRPVRENLSAADIARFVKRSVRGIGFGGEKAKATTIVQEMNISVPHIDSAVGDLSGGNQQKVLLGRWLSMAPEIIIFDEPTKGVDIGAKFDIHNAILKLAATGVAVIVASSDLPELLTLSHRIAVMRKGRIVGELDRSEFDSVKIISLAAGSSERSA